MPSAPSTQVRPDFITKVSGATITPEIAQDIISIEVDLSVDVPDMATLIISDSALGDLPHLNTIVGWIGQPIEISTAKFSGQRVSGSQPKLPLFKGEVVGIEPRFEETGEASIIVRAYDKRHRLNRETRTAAYLQKSASDIIKQIASEKGLAIDINSTSIIYQQLIQRNQTDLDFINYLARLNGFEVRFEDPKLIVKPPADTTSVPLEWGVELRSFYPRLSLSGQVNEVSVKAWDLKNNAALVGTATTSKSQPSIGYGKWGGQAAQAAFSAAKHFEVEIPMENQSEATNVAESILNRINTDFIEADGSTFGNPDIKPGKAVEISRVGPKFSGKYIITSATHVYTPDADYITFFRIEGAQRKLMADLLNTSNNSSEQISGLVVAVVTNLDDPDGIGRVKVKYPLLKTAPDNTELESFWAPVVSIGGGKDTGIFWLPEVNDTVLLGFENGNVNRPFVLGGVWNSKAATPIAKGDLLEQSSKVKTRVLQTRTGHKIVFTDSDSSSKLEIMDKGAVTKITFDTQNKALGIESQGKGTFKTAQAMEMKSDATINIQSTGSLTIKGSSISVEASGTLTLKGATVNIN